MLGRRQWICCRPSHCTAEVVFDKNDKGMFNRLSEECGIKSNWKGLKESQTRQKEVLCVLNNAKTILNSWARPSHGFT